MGACLPTREICSVKVVLRVRSGRGELELCSIDEDEEGDNAGSVDEVLVRDFLSSAEILEMRTTGLKWNVAELWFFFMKKDENDNPSPSRRVAQPGI